MTAAVAAVAPPVTLEHLFMAEYRRVVAIARRIVADAAEAEDVAQEVFADLARRRMPGRPSAWVHAAAAHRAAQEAAADPARSAERGELREALRTAMRRLRRRDAALLALRYGGDLTYKEIANALRLPLPHVGMLLARAEAALFREMHRD